MNARVAAILGILATVPACTADPPARPAPAPAAPPATEQVVLTERAAEVVRNLAKKHGTSYLRVTAAEGGGVKLDLDPDASPEVDLISESRGVRVAVDRASATRFPPGIVVDHVDQGGDRGFKFSAPAAVREPAAPSESLADARKGFRTALVPPNGEASRSPAPVPPPEVFRLVRYDAAPGQLAAYVSPDPGDGAKHPAIVWITGGDCNSIDGGCWQEGPLANDQSAAAYRKAGLVMMFPSLRGGNDNPGAREGFLGEVDDVLAAAGYLAGLPYVDPDRVYLGGHSTGATLALLTAACSDRFRAVFAFGPAADVFEYGGRYAPFAPGDVREWQMRAPVRWLHGVRTPTFVIEGEGGNADSLRALAAVKNPRVTAIAVAGADHFDVLGRANRVIAGKLRSDTGPAFGLTFTKGEFDEAFR